jgi:hypothetical protein
MDPGNDAHASQSVTERFLRLADFMGFGEHEVRVVRESRKLLSPLAPAIVVTVYDHLLRYPETARFFTDAAGRPDEGFLAKRKETLSEWLNASLDVRLDGAFAEYLYRVGLAHCRAGVPAEYVTGTIGFAQAAIMHLLAMHGDASLPAIEAWSKLLILQLDLLLAPYEAESVEFRT